MATMVPTSLDNLFDTTAGERKLFNLFHKLPSSCVVRYEMLLGQRDYRPDFTLIDPNRGILIVEVKDWSLDSITKATPEQFWIRGLRGSSVPKPIRNPDKKCQTYLRNARDQLVAMPTLQDDSGRLAVPIDYFVAFPNINQAEFRAQGFDQLVPPERVLFQEDLTREGISFIQRYESVLPPLSTPLNELQQGAITAALLPDTSIPLGAKLISEQTSVVQLDHVGLDTYSLSLEQEQIAKSLGEGPRLLRGIAGTGKTLIMLYRAKLLAANDQTGSLRILILCWNISLANYMRQAYDRLQIQAEGGQVVIKHFADFCRNFLKRQIEYDEFDDPDFKQELEAVRVTEVDRFDAIYIDEAQDFRKEWIEFLYHHLLKGEEPQIRNLLIAADDAQRVYPNRDFAWSELNVPEKIDHSSQGGNPTWSRMGIPMRGRTKILKTIYRNSARVWIFAAFLLGDEASYVKEQADKVRFSSKGGYDPHLIECPSPEVQIEEAINVIKKVIKAGYAARNILILYRHKNFRGFQWVDQLLLRLNRTKIPHEWIAEGQAKSTFAWEDNTVKISTVHSAKGMDSPIVIVLGAETFVDEFGHDETKLMYVALTRAREFLVVLHSGDKGLVPKLRECQEKYRRNRDAIIAAFEKRGGS